MLESATLWSHVIITSPLGRHVGGTTQVSREGRMRVQHMGLTVGFFIGAMRQTEGGRLKQRSASSDDCQGLVSHGSRCGAESRSSCDYAPGGFACLNNHHLLTGMPCRKRMLEGSNFVWQGMVFRGRRRRLPDAWTHISLHKATFCRRVCFQTSLCIYIYIYILCHLCIYLNVLDIWFFLSICCQGSGATGILVLATRRLDENVKRETIRREGQHIARLASAAMESHLTVLSNRLGYRINKYDWLPTPRGLQGPLG